MAVLSCAALPSDSYRLRKQVIAAGAPANSGPTQVHGVIAEPAATPSIGGQYRLLGGFHTPRETPAEELFKNGFENSP